MSSHPKIAGSSRYSTLVMLFTLVNTIYMPESHTLNSEWTSLQLTDHMMIDCSLVLDMSASETGDSEFLLP